MRFIERVMKRKSKVDLAVEAIRRTRRELKRLDGELKTTERQLLHKYRP